jgi:CheY-like chemotaxis protein
MTDRRPKIVVIDDSAAAIALYQRSAEGLGVQLESFRSPTESLQHLESNAADLVFTGIMMREADGWGILKQLNSWAHHQDTPVIVVTMKNYAQDRALAAQLGAREYLVKPLRSQEIREIICKYTGAGIPAED